MPCQASTILKLMHLNDKLKTLIRCFILILLFIAPTCSQSKLKTNIDRKSTCAQAHENCERDETCRWHISELQMKCRLSEDCQRTHCASAMRRFARYVNKSLLESMMFCQCAFSDVSCKHQQNWMYPRCLYDNGQMKPKYTCSQAVQLCQHDSYCSRTFNALNRSCPLSQGAAGGCIAKDLAECRLALIGVRGTDLESPCYCDKGDEKCLEYQNMVLPNNPCVEDSMIDFVESGSIATASDRQLPKIKSTKSSNTRRNQKKSKITTTTTSTTTSTTTTTEAPPSEENELVSEEIVESNEEEEKTSETVEEDNQLEESDEKQLNNLNATAVSSENLSKKSTIASEIKTNMPSKGIKISKKPGTSTAKIISGQKLVTQTPPSTEKGCSTRNLDGEWITHYKNSVFRQYNDLAGRCSSYCECSENEKATCSQLSCMPEGSCKTSQTTINFGERIFIEGRGFCLCHSGQFICDSSEEVVELDPGIYISLGFSRDEIKMIKEKVPKNLLEKCGLVSPDSSVQNDIASRLQFLLERVLPKNMLCRVALIERYSRESVILLQIQWYGADKYKNGSKEAWHVGKLEKVCSPYIKRLEDQFMLEKAGRYQLVLSTVKQLRVYDLLDGLPVSSNSISLFHCPMSTLILSLFISIATIKLLSTTSIS